MPDRIEEFIVFDVKQTVDSRGSFIKLVTENEDVLPGVEQQWAECFFTTSRRGAIRGMHYQMPPHSHAKIVYCLSGEILDVGLDLRPGTTGEVKSVPLHSGAGKAVYLPVGFAHGFQVLSETATLLYLQTVSHVPQSDTGIRYSSFSFEWPLPVTDISERDINLPPFDQERVYF